MHILIDSKGKKYLTKTEDLHTEAGYIKKEDMINSVNGDEVETHLGKKFTVVEANINDYIEMMERRCSIILPKDLGMMAAYTGLGSGQTVLDAGTGAGATAIFMGNIVGEQGKVYSYEIREDFADIAEKNIINFGLNNVEIKCQDVTQQIDETGLDLIFLDLPKPWLVVESSYDSLKSGGYLAVYSPFLEQLMTLHKVIKKVGFSNIDIIECLVRGMEIKSRGTRPKTRMTGHTGYLTFARKI